MLNRDLGSGQKVALAAPALMRDWVTGYLSSPPWPQFPHLQSGMVCIRSQRAPPPFQDAKRNLEEGLLLWVYRKRVTVKRVGIALPQSPNVSSSLLKPQCSPGEGEDSLTQLLVPQTPQPTGALGRSFRSWLCWHWRASAGTGQESMSWPAIIASLNHP